MNEKQIASMKREYKGAYNHWTGALQHIAVMSRIDCSYAIMRLSGYNSAPSLPCYTALHHFMQYLFHHPHVPIMYPRKKVKTYEMTVHCAKGEGEIKDLNKIKEYSGYKMWADSDLARDVANRRSVTSLIHEYNGVAFAWKSKKQNDVADCTNRAEIQAYFMGIKRVIQFRRFKASLGSPIGHPTPAYEDNDAVISQVKQDKLTPRIKHLDIPMTWLHEQGLKGTYVAIYTPTGRNKADMNTKPHGGANLQTMNMAIIGYQHYPPEGTEHYNLLQIGQYNIGPHRGSFRKETKMEPKPTEPKPKPTLTQD